MQLLESHDISSNVWLFLEIKDIVYLMRTSKTTREMCIEINKVVTAIIKISEINRLEYKTEQTRKMFRNIIQSFPNISKFIIDDDKKTIFRKELLSEIYNCDSLRGSLKEFKVVTGDKGLTGISNLRNLLSLDLS